MRRPLPRPTDTEVAILRVLWTHGPTTVRRVHEVLSESRDAETGYTTTLKLMHVYAATVPQDQTQRLLVADLVDRAFGGSAAALVMQALSARPVTPEQLEEIRQLIKEEEESRK